MPTLSASYLTSDGRFIDCRSTRVLSVCVCVRVFQRACLCQCLFSFATICVCAVCTYVCPESMSDGRGELWPGDITVLTSTPFKWPKSVPYFSPY